MNNSGGVYRYRVRRDNDTPLCRLVVDEAAGIATIILDDGQELTLTIDRARALIAALLTVVHRHFGVVLTAESLTVERESSP